MIDLDTLFARLGRFFAVGDDVCTALKTTVPDEVDDALQGLGATLTTSYEAVRAGVREGLSAFQSSGNAALASLVRAPSQQLVRLTASDDEPSASTVLAAAREVIRQMDSQSETVDASTVAASVSYGSGNTGDGVVVASVKRADGLSAEHIFAETLEAVVTAVAANGSATLAITGEPTIAPLSPTWPGGSGVSRSLTSRVSASAGNLVSNGGFEESDDNSDHLPEDWIAPVATLGTTLKLSSVEVQTVAISGTPTGGFYVLHWTNAASDQQTTAPLAYNASAATVQAALRALVGLENVTVTQSGTSPDLTHTITFTGVTNPAQLTSTSALTGGTPAIAHNTSTAASANVLRGARSVELDSDGSQLTTLMQPVALDPATQYAVNLFAKVDSVPAAGVLTVDLVDGVGGTVIADDAGTNNSFTIDATGLTTSWVAQSGFFRTPTAMPATCFLRVRISTAVSTGTSVFLDEAYLGEPDELYTDGLVVAAFTGPTDWVVGDRASVAVTNDRAGLIHEWFNRVFSLRENRLLLPSDNAGNETIDDALVA